MAVKKFAETADEAVVANKATLHDTAPTSDIPQNQKPDGSAPGFCVYIGPSIQGVIQSGAVYPGTKEQTLAAPSVAFALARHPLIASLIVEGNTLAEDRIKVKTAGNLLYVNYKKLASGKKV